MIDFHYKQREASSGYLPKHELLFTWIFGYSGGSHSKPSTMAPGALIIITKWSFSGTSCLLQRAR